MNSMDKRGVLTIVSGFSGSGKGTIMKKLVEMYNYELSISVTTRNKRDGEEDGKDYFFLTRKEFESMIESDELIEWAEYVGNYYGTPKEYVETQLANGKDVILEIEIQGALKVKKKFKDALLLFITPPTATILKERLVSRGTEKDDIIEKRLLKASEESDLMELYDYIVVNDELEECVNLVHQIINSEHNKSGNNKKFISQIQKELKEFQKGDQ